MKNSLREMICVGGALPGVTGNGANHMKNSLREMICVGNALDRASQLMEQII